MKQLELDSIKRWVAVGSNKLSHPVSISSACAGCSKEVVFSTKRRHYDANRDTLSCSGDCPACNSPAHFWITNLVAHNNPETSEKPQVFMMPTAATRMNLQPLIDTLPASVLQYCKSTQDVYYSGNLTATNIMVQSTIDAMFNGFLTSGNSRTTLSRLVQDAIPSIDLDEPLVALATSLRDDGHLQALFNQNEHTDQETADAFMALIESLITYLYVLPKEFNDLNERLSVLGQAAALNSETVASNTDSIRGERSAASERIFDQDSDDDKSHAARSSDKAA